MELILNFLWSFLSGLTNRISGGWLLKKIPNKTLRKWVERFSDAATGLLIGLITIGFNWYLLIMAFSGWVSRKFGPGHPKGYIVRQSLHLAPEGLGGEHNELETWQPEILRHRPYLSLILYGVMKSLPFAFLLFIPNFSLWFWIILGGFMISVPLGMWTDREIEATDNWDKSEFFELFFLSIILTVFGILR